MKTPTQNFSSVYFFNAYVECALWSSVHYGTDENGKGEIECPFDQVDADLSQVSFERMADDCAQFQALAEKDLSEYYENGQTPENAGHDFWLTRNGHGAGFWDRGLGVLGDRLSKHAKSFGPADLVLGDDGFIYCE